MRICGIDPGRTGAVCVLDSNIPTYTALLDLKDQSAYEVAKWINSFNDIEQVWIEDVHSLFGMSAKSNFSFGRNFGMISATAEIATYDGPIHKVTPKVWQKFCGVTAKGKEIKKQVAEIASKLYPLADLYGKRGGLLDGRADSLMITYYGLMHKD